MGVMLLVLLGWLALSLVTTVLVAAVCRGGHLGDDVELSTLPSGVNGG